jgi:hypothetical protein
VAAADARRVISRALRTCSFICCALVVASFGLFSISQASGASKQQVATLSSTVPAAVAAHPPGQPKRFIDGSARVLTSPFRSFLPASSEWATEIIGTLCALVPYGFGLGYLARWART